MPRQAEDILQYDDFLGWTVSSLKDFLSLRGLKQTGHKSELVARAFEAYELNAPIRFTHARTNLPSDQRRMYTKVEVK